MKVECKNCKILFNKLSYEIKRSPNHFCCRKCSKIYHTTKKLISCIICNINFYRIPSDINKNNFCSSKCAAIFNNKLKKKSRRSKCEILLFELLCNEFPSLKILSNDKFMLNGLEVDIAIPELKLAIEWNGIVHFKPIYGIEKLLKTQSKDTEKLLIASNKNINLIIISDYISTSEFVYKQFNIIKQHINFLKRLDQDSNLEK